MTVVQGAPLAANSWMPRVGHDYNHHRPQSVERSLVLTRPENREAYSVNRPGLCRRLQTLRTWSHEQIQKVFPGGSQAGRSDGLRTRARAYVAVATIESIAAKIGCTTETLRKWVRQCERDEGRRAGVTSDERARLKELEREYRELRRANEILRKSSAYFAQAELHRQPR